MAKKSLKKAPKSRKALKLVAIHWLDAAGDHDGEDVEPIHAITTGYVIKDTPEFVRIASEIFEDGSYRSTTAIPRGMIQGIIVKPTLLPPQFVGWTPKQ